MARIDVGFTQQAIRTQPLSFPIQPAGCAPGIELLVRPREKKTNRYFEPAY
jgi:hypothetical protein